MSASAVKPVACQPKYVLFCGFVVPATAQIMWSSKRSVFPLFFAGAKSFEATFFSAKGTAEYQKNGTIMEHRTRNDNSGLGQDTDSRTRVIDGFYRVFHLKQAP